MKRVFSLLLALLLVLTTTPLSVFADIGVPTVYATVDQEAVCPGDTVTVTVSMKNNPGLACWQIFAEYDDTALTLQQQTPGDAFGGVGSLSFGPAKTPTNALWYDFLNGDYTNNGTLFSLTFLVNEEAAPGEYVIRLYPRDEEGIVDSDLEPVEFVYESPSVQVAHTYDGTCDEECNACGALREGYLSLRCQC